MIIYRFLGKTLLLMLQSLRQTISETIDCFLDLISYMSGVDIEEMMPGCCYKYSAAL